MRVLLEGKSTTKPTYTLECKVNYRSGGMVDPMDLKSIDPKGSCGFESHLRYWHLPRENVLVRIEPYLSKFGAMV
jgi:hypothetical protein